MMSRMTINKFLEKALDTGDLGTRYFQGAGRLAPEQQKRFLQMTEEESVMLKLVRRDDVTNPAGEIHKIQMDTPVTYSATALQGEATEPTQYEAAPTFSMLSYTTVKNISWMDISTEIGEENITGSWAGFKQALFEAWSRRMANDLELTAIQGNDGVGAADATARCRSINDGWLKLIVEGSALATNPSYLIDWGGNTISDDLFSEMIRTLPTKYTGKLNEFRFFGPFVLEQDLRDHWLTRGTALGDVYINTREALRPRGVEWVTVPLWPDASIADFDDDMATPPGVTGHYVLLAHPQNLRYIVSRDMESHLEYKPRKDAWEATFYSRTDYIVENYNSCVLAYNIAESTLP